MPSKLIESLRGDLRSLEKAGVISKVTMHTTASTVRKWEQGKSRPAGPALKLLNVIADKGLEAVL